LDIKRHHDTSFGASGIFELGAERLWLLHNKRKARKATSESFAPGIEVICCSNK
jgi:hypothetical protein